MVLDNIQLLNYTAIIEMNAVFNLIWNPPEEGYLLEEI